MVIELDSRRSRGKTRLKHHLRKRLLNFEPRWGRSQRLKDRGLPTRQGRSSPSETNIFTAKKTTLKLAA